MTDHDEFTRQLCKYCRHTAATQCLQYLESVSAVNWGLCLSECLAQTPIFHSYPFLLNSKNEFNAQLQRCRSFLYCKITSVK